MRTMKDLCVINDTGGHLRFIYSGVRKYLVTSPWTFYLILGKCFRTRLIGLSHDHKSAKCIWF